MATMMKKMNLYGVKCVKKYYILLLFIILLSACADQQPPKKLEVDMKNVDGDSLGNITLEEQAHGVKFSVKLEGLPPGDHAIHVHDKGKCERPDFLSAGNHFNPDDKDHGLLNPKGPHAGDLPNLIVKDDGKVKVHFTAKELSLKEGKTSLYTKDGTSIIIHDAADDGMSQPAGDSGDRIACGEISKDRKPAKSAKQ